MINLFLINYRLKLTYRINTIIYVLQNFPFIRHFFPNRLYGIKWIKVVAVIISFILEIVGILFGSFLYVWLIIFFLQTLSSTNPVSTLFHMFIFLSIIGGLINTPLFQTDVHGYYAVILLKMDARKRTLSEFIYYVVTRILALTISLFIFGSSYQLPHYLYLLLPCFVMSIKFSFGYLTAAYFSKHKKFWREKIPFFIQLGLHILLLICALLPCYLGYPLPLNISLCISILLTFLGFYHFYKLWNFNEYLAMLKPGLSSNARFVNNKNKLVKENVSKEITYHQSQTSSKHGFSFLHDLFVKRHRTILKRSANRLSFGLSVVFILGIMLLFYYKELFANTIDSSFWRALSALPLIMYFVNRGPRYTQALFFNCDVALLTYRIYRRPDVILGMFKQRLITLILINLQVAIVVSFGLLGILYVVSPSSSFVTFTMVGLLPLSLASFFSVHDLVLYYLLQPYNAQTEIKSGLYSFIRQLTYFICLMIMNMHIPLDLYGSIIILFCVLYIGISLVLIYLFAHKTFKIRN